MNAKSLRNRLIELKREQEVLAEIPQTAVLVNGADGAFVGVWPTYPLYRIRGMDSRWSVIRSDCCDTAPIAISWAKQLVRA
jgi:hypothetical protein